VRLDVFGDVPGEQQVLHLLVSRGLGGDDLQARGGQLMIVGRLHQPATADALDVEGVAAVAGRDLQHPYVLFGGEDFECFGIVGGRQQHFDELLRSDGLRGGDVNRAVEGNDAAESGGG